MLTILIGKSAAGKDTLLNKMVNNEGYTPVISYTTRPRRKGEVDGKDYNFVSEEYFQNLVASESLAEFRSYNTVYNGISDVWFYGTPRLSDIQNKKYIIILDVNGAKETIKEYGPENIEVMYLYAPDDVREKRARERGSFDILEWERRKKDDALKFSEEQINSLQKILQKEIKMINN